MEIREENAVLWFRIEKLDLGAVRAKLMDPRGSEWDSERADRAVTQYRRFLFLAGTAGEPVVPTREIDEVWHTHVLHTSKYAKDCERLFGRFIHHAPAAPDAPASERARLRGEFVRTAELYRAAFGEEYGTDANGTCDDDQCGIHSCDDSCTCPLPCDDDVRAARGDCDGSYVAACACDDTVQPSPAGV